ncbi:MAG: aldehyde dehydrogenase family protein [Nocardioidaceae bacterium]|nr:aldehyde dehydrogenase family protein [Nocardioidaceae bacterium]
MATSEFLDSSLESLRGGALRWPGVSLEDRARLLHEVASAAVATAGDWVAAASQAKRLAPQSPLAGEEWISGPYPVAMNAATLAHSIESLAAGKSPLDDRKFSEAPSGRTKVKVFPTTIWDRLLLSGFSANVWFEPGMGEDTVRHRAGLAQLDPQRPVGVSVVLGAGNITSIAVLDTLYEVFAHNRAVILKLNPVMDDMRGPTERVLASLIAMDMVRVVQGGADVGAHLVDHSSVDHVHITGSSQSHDTIVFGVAGPDGTRPTEPRLKKSITSELGGVSPSIVVPGRWSKRDLKFQAEHLVTQRLHNGGYNCIAAQVIVIPSAWDQKEEFLTYLRAEFDAAPSRVAYYPGSDDRVASAVGRHENAVQCANGRVLITGLRDDCPADVFSTEYFSPVLGVVEVPGVGDEYLTNAARFVNDELVGTLGANVVIHPRQRRGLGTSFDSFVASLRYGTIAINAWTAFGYLTAAVPWGGFPGATIDNVESGIGVVHNSLLLDGTERTVIDGPFRPFPRSLVTGQLSISPKPAWFVRNRTGAKTAELLVRFVAAPAWSKLPRIFLSALRG